MSYVTRRKFVLSSALQKKGEVEDLLGQVKQRREVEEIKLNKVIESLEDGKKQLKEIEEALVDIEQKGDEYVEAVINRIHESLNILSKSDEIIRSYMLVISQLDNKIQGQKAELADISLKQEEARKSLDAESSRLAAWAMDLNIYRNRLAKQIKDNNLDIKILEP